MCSRQDEARLRAAYKQQREALGKEIDDEFFEQGSLEHEMTQLNRRIEKRQRMAGATLLDVEVCFGFGFVVLLVPFLFFFPY